MTPNFSQTAAYIWNLADLLRGDFKQSQYGRIILPFTVLRRLECVLEATKSKVLKEAEKHAGLSSNETAGEHFTPRDIVRLTTSLVFMEDDEVLRDPGIIRTIYDPTAGTGGFLSSGMEYVHELNPEAVMRAFGQELNAESYAICKADMLIKGQDVSRIKLGNTLSDDQLYTDKFDYMLSNPPFGVDWKKIEEAISAEHKVKGFDGRFGPGLPRVSDGSLLFLMHLLSKMRDYDASDKDKNGGRIGIILSTRGRPSSKKADKRVFGCKIFRSHEFGYRRITIERPLCLSVQFTEERLASLRFESGALSAPMQKLYENFGSDWKDKAYGDFSEVEVEARVLTKADFPDLKEKQIKDLLNRKPWLAQKELLGKAQSLAKVIGANMQMLREVHS